MSSQAESCYNWNRWNVTCLWAGVVISLPAYSMGGLLVTLYKLNLSEASITILLSVSISYGLHYLGAKPGIAYRKGSQDLLKVSFGNIGARLPVILRGLLVAGWFGIDVLFGGMAVNLLLKSSLAINIPHGEVTGFFIFLLMTLALVVKGKESINKLEVLAVPGLLIVGLVTAIFVCIEVLQHPIQHDIIALSENSFQKISSSMVIIIGNLILMTLAMPDFSQFTKSQKEYSIGLLLGLEMTFFLFCLLGAFISYFSEPLTGVKSFDLITFLSTLQIPMMSIIASTILVTALLTTATVDLFVSATDFSKLVARKGRTTNWLFCIFSIAIISTLLVHFELINKLSTHDNNSSFQYWFDVFLKGASSTLSSVVAIYIIEFYLIKANSFPNGLDLKLDTNIKYSAVGIVLLSTSLTIIGFLFEQAYFMVKFGWLINFIVASITYYFINTELTQRYINSFSYTRFL